MCGSLAQRALEEGKDNEEPQPQLVVKHMRKHWAPSLLFVRKLCCMLAMLEEEGCLSSASSQASSFLAGIVSHGPRPSHNALQHNLGSPPPSSP